MTPRRRQQVNIRIDAHLVQELRNYVRHNDTTQRAVIEEGIRKVIAEGIAPKRATKQGNRPKKATYVREPVVRKADRLEARIKELSAQLPRSIARRVAEQEFKSK